eukprot:TRINITY_DN24949_c0_g1_i1.p1 TRINITY_DN24949_c0_g1~~TRINITY_DN24949_c0_g1_i1.p1  ORF type:complete len:246 (-),score=41.38 TRINITY_DN24949_c0_g1_i1:34-711(-)
MCIRDRFWIVILSFIHLLFASIKEVNLRKCFNSTVQVFESISNFSNLIASNQTNLIISQMIEKLGNIDESTNKANKRCQNIYLKLITNSKAPWDSSLCFHHLQNLRFRSSFAAHALSKTNDKEFALQNLKELAISSHGLVLNCTTAVLSYAKAQKRGKICNKIQLARLSQALQSKLFLNPSEKEFRLYNERLENYIRKCVPNELNHTIPKAVSYTHLTLPTIYSV